MVEVVEEADLEAMEDAVLVIVEVVEEDMEVMEDGDLVLLEVEVVMAEMVVMVVKEVEEVVDMEKVL